MNNTIQTILVLVTASIAVAFLVKKYMLKPKKQSNKGCGSGDCGCD